MLEIKVNGNNTFSIESKEGNWHINDVSVSCDVQEQSNGLISLLYNNKSYTAVLEKVDTVAKELKLNIEGSSFTLSVKEPMDKLLESMGLDLKALQKAEPVKAPMPGMILKIMVEPGQSISKGDGLLILEAMKMENVLKAGSDGVVKAINVKEQTAVDKGAILIELE